MKLSTKGRYAVMALFDMAQEGVGTVVSLQDIAARQNLSIHYLEQLFLNLRRAGLVEGIRGAQGGYILTKEPPEITMAMIMEAAKESFKTTRCADNAGGGCMGSSYCATHHLWAGLELTVNNYLNTVTLADLLGRSNQEQACAKGFK